MTLDEYLGIIADSEKSDWKYDDEHRSYLYKPNVSIMMVAEYREEDKELEEDWVTSYPTENAYVHIIGLYYNGQRIDDFYTAIVDGHRMCIPYPDNGTHSKITKQQYNIGRIINIPYSPDHCDRYDEYLRTAGISVV